MALLLLPEIQASRERKLKITTMIGTDGSLNTLDDVIATAKQAEAAGLDDVW